MLRKSVRCRVTGGFCLVVLWFAAVNGWGVLALVLVAALIHEAGHCLLLILLGGRITQLRLTLFGAELETDSRRLSYGAEMLAALAGPAANLLCAAVLTAAEKEPWQALMGANITLALFNLLPVRPLDGGRALYQLTAWAFGPAVGERICRGAAVLFGTLLAALLGYVMWRTGGSLWLLPPAAGLLSAVWRECFGQTQIGI